MIRRRGRRIRRRESTNCQVVQIQFVKIYRIVGMGDFWGLSIRRSCRFRRELLNSPQILSISMREVKLVL